MPKPISEEILVAVTEKIQETHVSVKDLSNSCGIEERALQIKLITGKNTQLRVWLAACKALCKNPDLFYVELKELTDLQRKVVIDNRRKELGKSLRVAAKEVGISKGSITNLDPKNVKFYVELAAQFHTNLTELNDLLNGKSH
jgi:hypothetical protein